MFDTEWVASDSRTEVLLVPLPVCASVSASCEQVWNPKTSHADKCLVGKVQMGQVGVITTVLALERRRDDCSNLWIC